MKPVMWSFGMQSRPLFHVGDHPDIEGVVKAAKKQGSRMWKFIRIKKNK